MSINVKKYLAKFESTSTYNTFAASDDYVTPNVSLIEENNANTVMYNPYVAPSHDYSQDYFTIEALESGTLNIRCAGGYLQYSLDGGETWSEEYGSIKDLSLNANDKILLKGDITVGEGESDTNSILYTGDFNVYGNIMSLVYGNNFANQTSLAGKDDIFASLFSNNKTLLSAENLILPATTLVNNCYKYMFYHCTSLTIAPELPATTLAGNCYNYMFCNCSSLTIAPELPATTLAGNCYNGMFMDCINLSECPELPATTLVYDCYNEMFKGCTNINSITCLATDISALGCTYDWVYGVNGVTVTGTFTKAVSMTNWTTGDSGIPEGWTVQDYVAS